MNPANHKKLLMALESARIHVAEMISFDGNLTLPEIFRAKDGPKSATWICHKPSEKSEVISVLLFDKKRLGDTPYVQNAISVEEVLRHFLPYFRFKESKPC